MPILPLMKINRFSLARPTPVLGLPCLLLLSAVFWLSAGDVALADGGTNAPAQTVSANQTAAKPDKHKADPPKQLSGVELYAIHCNRCHPERYPVEFNQNQWKTLMLHMRVRANLPASQARAILQYLQEEAAD